MKKELLAAVAAAALIAASGTAHAQSDKPMQGSPGGAQVQGQGDVKAQGTPGGAQVQGQGGAKVEGKTGAQPGQAQQPGRDAQPGQAERDAADRPGERQQQTQQQQTGDKPAQLTSEQRTEISSTIRQRNVDLRRIDRTEINFNISVGAVVPRTIQLAPLPAPILAVVPAYRGYLYVVVGDELLIIHPSTYEIVAVIPA